MQCVNNNVQHSKLDSNVEKSEIQRSADEYLHESMGDFDESFSNVTINVDETLNPLSPVERLGVLPMKRFPMMGESDESKLRILTGNISQVLKWSHTNVARDCLIVYETIGVYVSDWDGGKPSERTLLLRQPRGPVMKIVAFPRLYPPIPSCVPGQYLRVVGRMSEDNMMTADRILTSTETDYQRLERVAQICDRALKHN